MIYKDDDWLGEQMFEEIVFLLVPYLDHSIELSILSKEICQIIDDCLPNVAINHRTSGGMAERLVKRFRNCPNWRVTAEILNGMDIDKFPRNCRLEIENAEELGENVLEWLECSEVGDLIVDDPIMIERPFLVAIDMGNGCGSVEFCQYYSFGGCNYDVLDELKVVKILNIDDGSELRDEDLERIPRSVEELMINKVNIGFGRLRRLSGLRKMEICLGEFNEEQIRSLGCLDLVVLDLGTREGIPSEWLKYLPSGLEELKLSGWELGCVDGFKRFEKLDKLELLDCPGIRRLSQFKGLGVRVLSLRSVDWVFREDVEPGDFEIDVGKGDLVNLRRLELCGFGQVKGLMGLTCLDRLRELELGNLKVDTIEFVMMMYKMTLWEIKIVEVPDLGSLPLHNKESLRKVYLDLDSVGLHFILNLFKSNNLEDVIIRADELDHRIKWKGKMVVESNVLKSVDVQDGLFEMLLPHLVGMKSLRNLCFAKTTELSSRRKINMLTRLLEQMDQLTCLELPSDFSHGELEEKLSLTSVIDSNDWGELLEEDNEFEEFEEFEFDFDDVRIIAHHEGGRWVYDG